MAKVKMAKKSTSIDMTAMCDVAFLLLTFFILTATAKQPEALPVDTPNSTVQTKLPDSDLATIIIGENGKVFYGVTGRDVRVKTLEYMDEKYKVGFSDADKQKFALIENFGVPIQNLKQIINMTSSERNQKGLQPGIPKDSTDNQLADWILNSRKAIRDLHDKDLNIAIKGDAKEEYPQIKKVMDILQEQKVNSFNLVTGLRGKDF
ncbi:biopolymer transporter ExbD [Flavobacterium sp. MAH-1]|uniref:Biopolymer transporter ExbD n=1 Tax=Flavobacterium agri TaxID=2743471 RepID=A0A7Y9C8P5_9FLAO|nr:biopolymer transporter ExbD [Flavobacterium agri]NUY82609.1 biopolymer transporter ExbD [Flavobacterium agri]NYA72632.1 biopolymer transporter ExbD [Flavobacterium agri]